VDPNPNPPPRPLAPLPGRRHPPNPNIHY
jgi:hypothetical protein